MVIKDDIDIPGVGKSIKIFLTASQKTSIIVEIIDDDGIIVDKLNCNTTAKFKCEVMWVIDKDMTSRRV